MTAVSNGWPVREGERVRRCPLSGVVYIVTRWEDRGDHIRALEKTPVDEADGWDTETAMEVLGD